MDMDDNRILETDRIKVTLDKKENFADQRILDIGGGGEGIISMISGENVVAIDIRADELLEINHLESLKIVMDATRLSFIDQQFNRATVFYSFMYFRDQDIDAAIGEIHRVLRPGGIIEIWDIELPSKKESNKDIFIVHLEIAMEGLTRKTGYGIHLRDSSRNLSFYTQLLESNLFEIETCELEDSGIFHIVAAKRMAIG